jgi:hypothetical protein
MPMHGESRLSGLIAKGRAGIESGLFEFVIEFKLQLVFKALGIEGFHFLWSKHQF